MTAEGSDGGDLCYKKPFEVALSMIMGTVIVTTAYLALTRTFLNIQYRFTGEKHVQHMRRGLVLPYGAIYIDIIYIHPYIYIVYNLVLQLGLPIEACDA